MDIISGLAGGSPASKLASLRRQSTNAQIADTTANKGFLPDLAAQNQPGHHHDDSISRNVRASSASLGVSSSQSLSNDAAIDDSSEPDANVGKLSIPGDRVMALFTAAAISFSLGQPLNRYITIRLGGVRKIGPVLKRFGDWLRFLTSKPPIYVYTIEADPDLHIHILLHVPELQLDRFHDLLRGWLVSSGFLFHDGLYKSKRIHHSDPSDPDTEAYLCGGVLGLLRYVCKGVHPKAAAKFGISPVPQGRVIGKRCGYSEAISPNHGLPGPIEHPKGYGFASPELIAYDAVRCCWGEKPRLRWPRRR